MNTYISQLAAIRDSKPAGLRNSDTSSSFHPSSYIISALSTQYSRFSCSLNFTAPERIEGWVYIWWIRQRCSAFVLGFVSRLTVKCVRFTCRFRSEMHMQLFLCSVDRLFMRRQCSFYARFACTFCESTRSSKIDDE